MNTPKTKISVVANTWIKQMQFAKRGDIHAGHKHTFDHQTLVGAGKVKVTVDGKVSEFTAPTIIFIRAGLEHEIESLEDNTVCYCIHAIRDGERVEDIIDPEDIPETGMGCKLIQDGEAFVVPTPKEFIE
jgi:mannose-6-phosphate isomerase-like protein (cupin superfamily)